MTDARVAPIDRVHDRVILDTQVVLDWLVFRDPSTRLLATALEEGSLRWLTVPAMREELERVLARGVGATWLPDRTAIAAAFDRLAHPFDLRATGSPLHCRDPDDQIFIDLALAAGAKWLFTRDRALLELSSRARQHGVTVLRPSEWQGLSDDR